MKGAPAIVVLGCAVHPLKDGQRARSELAPDALSQSGRAELRPCALARRIEAAAAFYWRAGNERTLVIASGGRRWGGVVEADVMARELARQGVPANAILRERCSLSTRDNAHFAGEILARHGIGAAAIVTCAWHLPRALLHFRHAGVEVQPVPTLDGDRALWSLGLWRWSRERLLMWTESKLAALRWRARQP